MSNRQMVPLMIASAAAGMTFPLIANSIFHESHMGLPNGTEGNMFVLDNPGIYVATAALAVIAMYLALRTLDRKINPEEQDKISMDQSITQNIVNY